MTPPLQGRRGAAFFFFFTAASDRPDCGVEDTAGSGDRRGEYTEWSGDGETSGEAGAGGRGGTGSVGDTPTLSKWQGTPKRTQPGRVCRSRLAPLGRVICLCDRFFYLFSNLENG